MNKTNRLLFPVFILIMLVILSSCRTNPSGVDIVGVWDGRAQGLFADNTYFIDFDKDGTARLLGDVITDEGAAQTYQWKFTDFHLELSISFSTFKSLYAYEYSGDELTLYLLDDTNMTEAWDTLIPGQELFFSRAADGVTIQELQEEAAMARSPD